MKIETKRKILRSFIAFSVLLIAVLAITLPLHFTGTLDTIRNIDALKELIISGGAWSYLIFFAIQFIQVTFLPVPAAVTTIAGTLVFGPWITLCISYVAVMLASLFAFWLGKKIGPNIITWITDEASYKKWAEKLGKGKYVFFLMMLFPVFPDDILCMIAGTTTMSWRFFIFTNLISRPIGIFCTCFLSSGIIPFYGWWLILWAIIIIAAIILFFLSYKFQPQIENYILKLSKKFESKRSHIKEEKTISENKRNQKERVKEPNSTDDRKKSDNPMI